MTTEAFSLPCIVFLVISASLMCSSMGATPNREKGKPASLSLASNGFRVELSHVDSRSNFTQIELLRRAAARTMHRLSRLKGMQLFSSTNITTTMRHEETYIAEYLMDLAIGTPPLYYSAIADTGSDLIWTQCTPCKKCVSQPTPIYDPSSSTTFSPVSCNGSAQQYCSYNYTYGTGWTSGTLGTETFTFRNTKSVPVPNITFGCSTSTSNDFNGSAGLVGLGRGELSLIAQLNTGAFSYCLTSFLNTSSTSPLFFGPLAGFSGTDVQSTPFVTNPSRSPMSTYYYLSLQGISLGTTNLKIEPAAFTLQSNGTGGFIIDSGTTYTSLVPEAYEAMRDAIKSIVKLRPANTSDTIFKLCYSLPSDSSPPMMPNMTFHFEGADMVLPVQNYMVAIQELELWCLTIFGSGDNRSIFGNYQQQNFHILYDLDKGVLSFVEAECDSL